MNVETGNFETQKRLDLTSQSLDSLGDTVHRLSIGFSEGQIKTLKSRITSAQSQTPTRVLKDSCLISQREDGDALDTKGSTEAGRRLTSSLSRLARITHNTRTVAPSERASRPSIFLRKSQCSQKPKADFTQPVFEVLQKLKPRFMIDPKIKPASASLPTATKPPNLLSAGLSADLDGDMTQRGRSSTVM